MLLTVNNLVKRYDDFELSISNLSIASGTAFGLVGSNGAGKTTFLRLVLDLACADHGGIQLDGTDVADSILKPKIKITPFN